MNSNNKIANKEESTYCPYFLDYYRGCGVNLNDGEKGVEMIIKFCAGGKFADCDIYKIKIEKG